MKLELNKQAQIRLSATETNSINGGGKKRSKRLNGDCKYSRRHGDSATEYCEGSNSNTP